MEITATPAQEEFLAAVFSGDYRYLAYGGGIRGGKTWAVLLAVLLLCRAFPRSRWAIVRKDLPVLRRNTLPSFTKLRPRRFCGLPRSDTWVARCVNGSEIVFFPESRDTDPDWDRWKGLEVNGFVLEEANELDPGSFEMAKTRAGAWIIPPTPEDATPRQPPPLILCTFNPAPGWVKNVFYDPWRRGELAPPYFFRQALARDNPHLTQAYLDGLEDLSETEYRRYVLGEWDNLTGAALPMIEPRVHLVPPFRVPDYWLQFGAFDWGYRHLWAFGHFAVNEDGMVWCVDTLRGRRHQPEEILDRIRTRVPLHRLDYTDAGHDLWDQHQARGVSGPTLADQFLAGGLSGLRRARRDRVQGLNALRRALSWRRPDGRVDDPLLRFFDTPGNRWLLEQLQSMVLDPDGDEDVLKQDADEQGRGGDDGYDMVRYAAAGRWSHAFEQIHPDANLNDPTERAILAAAQKRVARFGTVNRRRDAPGVTHPDLAGYT